jgi:hypothetical protein
MYGIAKDDIYNCLFILNMVCVSAYRIKVLWLGPIHKCVFYNYVLITPNYQRFLCCVSTASESQALRGLKCILLSFNLAGKKLRLLEHKKDRI